MIKISSISWQIFFTGIIILLLVWLFTSRTKLGRSFILNYSIWTIEQWTRVLIVVGVTLFILVNPLFHILTAVVLISFYYLFVGKKLTPITKTGDWELPNKIPLFDRTKTASLTQMSFTCKPVESKSLILDRTALNRCLFSFPYILTDDPPKVNFMNETFHVSINLNEEKYIASLHSYLQSAGYSITHNLPN